MDAEIFVKLIEEMIELKLQKHPQGNTKTGPELATVLESKTGSDRRRLEQIRLELVRQLKQ